mmetsp:Transcript_28655/g.90420  ORF Transcript_28655/g.90420 Transcript_28655/m.90420 type:complete len:255 (+) Transcript_28655:115-879(+)
MTPRCNSARRHCWTSSRRASAVAEMPQPRRRLHVPGLGARQRRMPLSSLRSMPSRFSTSTGAVSRLGSGRWARSSGALAGGGSTRSRRSAPRPAVSSTRSWLRSQSSTRSARRSCGRPRPCTSSASRWSRTRSSSAAALRRWRSGWTSLTAWRTSPASWTRVASPSSSLTSLRRRWTSWTGRLHSWSRTLTSARLRPTRTSLSTSATARASPYAPCCRRAWRSPCRRWSSSCASGPRTARLTRRSSTRASARPP